jgi:hypothetical protein
MPKRLKQKHNPITLSRNAKIGIGVAVAAGLAVVIYYATKSSSSSTTTAPISPTAPSGGSTPIPPSTPLPPVISYNPPPSTPTSPSAPIAPTTPTSTTVTEANSGQTFNMHVGDTLVVVLDITAPITDYTSSLTGTNLSASSVTDLTNQMFQTWTATGTGSATIIYTPTGGTQNIQFSVVVS